MAISYEPIKHSVLEVVYVKLDEKIVGRIQREHVHAGGFYYRPADWPWFDKEVCPSLDECKRSLEKAGGMSLVKLSQEQLTQLQKRSDRKHVVSLVIGIGWLGFDYDDPEMQWALDLLTQPNV